jgi:hypothetical protein
MLKSEALKPINQDGMSTFEVMPILLMFGLLINFTLGFFGVVHSGILNNIAARNYAFETFRNRADLNYLRDDPDWVNSPNSGGVSVIVNGNYNKAGLRFHGIANDKRADASSYVATQRSIKFSNTKDTGRTDDIVGTRQEHLDTSQVQDGRKASDIFTGKTKDEGRAGVDPVWIKTLYGICLTSDCSKPKYLP